MRRLAATFATDIRVQRRNGFYLATAAVVLATILLLRSLPGDAAQLLLPAALLANVIVNTFYFVSGLLLLERVEGTFVAQAVTPLRDAEYVASKVATLTLLSLAESLLIAAAVVGVDARLATLALGVVLSAVLFCLAGISISVRYDSINELLLPSVAYTLLLGLPALGLFGVGPVAWYVAHPVQGPLALMGIDPPRTSAGLAYAIGYPVLWMLPAYAWSRRSLARLRRV